MKANIIFIFSYICKKNTAKALALQYRSQIEKPNCTLLNKEFIRKYRKKELCSYNFSKNEWIESEKYENVYNGGK